MKAIIISDAESRALLDKLKLASMLEAGHFRQYSEPLALDKPADISSVHRAFHMVVCRWLQEMGADTVGR